MSKTEEVNIAVPVKQAENQDFKCPTQDALMEAKSEWDVIDSLVFYYQGLNNESVYDNEGNLIADPVQELLNRFQPLFKKYINLLKTGQINFNNLEQKLFVSLFVNDPLLKKAMFSKSGLDKQTKAQISARFNFVKETYGNQDEYNILTDLYVIFLTLARRYKKKNRSFACYVYNSIRFEVYRMINKYTHNPVNIHYKNLSYEECLENNYWEFADDSVLSIEEQVEFNEEADINYQWIQGVTCSEVFKKLTPLERKIVTKYYLEGASDKQVANEYKLHINTCNSKRHTAIEKIAAAVGLTKKDVKRSRNTGKHR